MPKRLPLPGCLSRGDRHWLRGRSTSQNSHQSRAQVVNLPCCGLGSPPADFILREAALSIANLVVKLRWGVRHPQ